MISNQLSERTLANLEVALERACQRLGRDGMQHECRKFVAIKMIAAAREGATTLAMLTQVGFDASAELMKNNSVAPSIAARSGSAYPADAARTSRL